MKKLLIIALLFVGCATTYVVTEYKGAEIIFGKENPIIILTDRQDVMDENYHYMTIRFHSSVLVLGLLSNCDDGFSLSGDQLFKKELMKFMNEFAYTGYHIRKVHKTLHTKICSYQIHFHKTEEEFDKWDERYFRNKN